MSNNMEHGQSLADYLASEQPGVPKDLNSWATTPFRTLQEQQALKLCPPILIR